MNENTTNTKKYIIIISEMCDGNFYHKHSEKYNTNQEAHFAMVEMIDKYLNDYLDTEVGQDYTDEMLKAENIEKTIYFNEASLVWRNEPLNNYLRYNIVEI